MSSGFRDKLYWRPARSGLWHCYKKCSDEGGYISLCHDHHRVTSGGQECSRPPAIQRCARCDVAEMKRRGWDESGPESREAGR